MKKLKNILFNLIIMIFFANICLAQENDTSEMPISYINTLCRYTEGKGIEIRFFPDKKSVLELGFKNGFIVERLQFDTSMKRSNIDSLNFEQIANILPFKDFEWDAIIKSTSNEDVKKDLEMARDFLNNIEKKTGTKINLDQGISELKDEKSREDYQYMIFALTALKNADVAKALGLSFLDASVQSGKQYFYRVRVVGKSEIYKLVSIPTDIIAEKQNKGYDVKVYVQPGDKELFFAWIDPPELSGYYIERANPGEKTFTQLNKAPIYSLNGEGYEGEIRSGYNDKNLENYKLYTYRFFGFTAFGEKVQFAELQAMAKDLTPPEQPFLPQPQHISPKEVLVTWKMNPEPAGDLKGFYLARADKNEGDFKVLHNGLLSKDTRTLIDTSFITGQANYYLVQAIDTANNLSSSFPVSVALIDSTPPSKPVFISGKIDSLGIVTITVEKNKEKDLMGYRLFKANSLEHEFSVIYEGFINNDSAEQVVQTVFIDTTTLNSLTPYIYYRIKALDFNYNQSEFSEILKVKRPDTIPPITPVFTNVSVREKEVELAFVLSESEDVIEHTLYRKTSINAPWDSLTSIEINQKTYIDKNVKQGISYYYSMRAKDDSRNYSKYAQTVYGKPFDNGQRPPIENLSISKDKDKIALVWEYKEFNKDTYFVIYKKDSKGNFREYNNTKVLRFEDSNPIKGLNTYAVKVFTNDGGQSKISKEVEYLIKE